MGKHERSPEEPDALPKILPDTIAAIAQSIHEDSDGYFQGAKNNLALEQSEFTKYLSNLATSGSQNLEEIGRVLQGAAIMYDAFHRQVEAGNVRRDVEGP